MKKTEKEPKGWEVNGVIYLNLNKAIKKVKTLWGKKHNAYCIAVYELPTIKLNN